MKESEFGGPPPRESGDYKPDQLPEIESTPVDKAAITEAILSNVIAASESGRSLVQEYELPQNRGDISIPPNNTPMQSLGDILEKQAMEKQAKQLVDESHAQSNLQAMGANASNRSGISNSQAIKYGIASAVIFAAIILVVMS